MIFESFFNNLEFLWYFTHWKTLYYVVATLDPHTKFNFNSAMSICIYDKYLERCTIHPWIRNWHRIHFHSLRLENTYIHLCKWRWLNYNEINIVVKEDKALKEERTYFCQFKCLCRKIIWTHDERENGRSSRVNNEK